ncbi:MAG: cell wall-binding repeat-containing protein [Bradymonadaceae bacterium]|nr:cell wall-binding repeat-containing protein [Lujinxingiaceae bacterium]
MLRKTVPNSRHTFVWTSLIMAMIALSLAWSSCSDTKILLKPVNNDKGECTGSACDSCEDVECETGEVCYRGVCHASCEDDAQCGAGLICTEQRCAAADCSLAPCRDGEVCFRGICHEACERSDDCPGEQVCEQGRCTLDDRKACEGSIDCPDGHFCSRGFCAATGREVCGANGTCASAHQCYEGLCFSECPAGGSCPGGSRCYADQQICLPLDGCDEGYCQGTDVCDGGICYPGLCEQSTDCPSGHFCRRGYCKPTEREICGAGGTCSTAHNCYQGLCFPECENEEEPCGPNASCLLPDNVCLPLEGCIEDYCQGSQVCDDGFCLQGCQKDSQCAPGQDCIAGLCTPSLCVNVVCPQGECYRGDCVSSGCPAVPCAAGSRCNQETSLCEAVACERTRDCPDDSRCQPNGFCQPNDCTNIVCPSARPVCEDGTCRRCAQVDRVYGVAPTLLELRHTAAANFALKRFHNGAKTAILARYTGPWVSNLGNHDSPVDAMVAGPLAYQSKGPILFSQGNRLMPVTKQALDRLGVENVFILGGDVVIDAALESWLIDEGYNVIRLAGETRVETAIEVANRLDPGQQRAFVLAWDQLLMSVNAGGVAAARGQPMLVVRQDHVPDSTSAYLSSHGINTTIALGDSSVISDGTLSALPGPTRVPGQRGSIAYSAAFANYAALSGPIFNEVIFVNKDDLSVGVTAAAAGRIVLLSESASLDEATETFLRTYAKTALLYGNLSLLSEQLEDAICAALDK